MSVTAAIPEKSEISIKYWKLSGEKTSETPLSSVLLQSYQKEMDMIQVFYFLIAKKAQLLHKQTNTECHPLL